MTRLFLLRHSRAGWAAPGMRDFDRPLGNSGENDAEAVGVMMRVNGYTPELVICSNACRARQTLEGVTRNLPIGRVVYSDGLYTTDAMGYVDIIRDAPEVDSILLIGHNPMIEDVAFALASNGDESAKSAMIGGFPTSALAIILFEGKLSDAAPGKGYLEAFLTPSDY